MSAVTALIRHITQLIHTSIKACNIHGKKKDNNFFAPLVYYCQQKCDEILCRTDYSLLKRIQLCAKEVESLKAGNCMQQSFVAFDALLKEFIATNLSTYDMCIPISICTYSNHAFLLINNIVCDPWNNFVGDLATSQYAGLKLDEYFGIRSDWTCYIDNKIIDVESTKYTYSLFENKKNTPSSEMFFPNSGCASTGYCSDEQPSQFLGS
ncbi:hypothetical protein [Legionella maioricensis]|uniref:Dot/Icm T4SS effector n=1 Tax=Legionella maioricensis TaxID=2896528 RepID=A0A9X2ICZ4_9GAMM|nr:hypothetical protein [Legionella maioricensis]MCL9684997.1 hypothetical protein [Legionella maioricensis]MCL9688106.1 hypothetical protein [Legionella maioricensis]